MYKWNKEQDAMDEDTAMITREKSADEIEKMQKLLAKKDEIKSQLIQNSNSQVYSYIDNLFVREIKHSEHYYTYYSAGMYIFFPPKTLDRFTCGNPVVDDYLNFIFEKIP
jgi:hypothetical protein